MIDGKHSNVILMLHVSTVAVVEMHSDRTARKAKRRAQIRVSQLSGAANRRWIGRKSSLNFSTNFSVKFLIVHLDKSAHMEN